jgi:hypothetical protein
MQLLLSASHQFSVALAQLMAVKKVEKKGKMG